MFHLLPNSSALHDEESSFSVSYVFLLLSLLCSLLMWLALYLPWSVDSSINGMGMPPGTSEWFFGAMALLGLNILCSLLWLWRRTRLTSVLIWGLVKVSLTSVMILLTFFALKEEPTEVGPWVYICALVGMLLCDWFARRRYPLNEILTIPLGEETYRPPG